MIVTNYVPKLRAISSYTSVGGDSDTSAGQKLLETYMMIELTYIRKAVMISPFNSSTEKSSSLVFKRGARIQQDMYMQIKNDGKCGVIISTIFTVVTRLPRNISGLERYT